MPLKRLGEKIKTSLHHLSPKSKKPDEAHGGDLSPCSLPPAATAQHQQPLCPTECKPCCEPNGPCENACAKAKEFQASEGLAAQQQVKEETARADTPAPTITTAEPDCGASACQQPCACEGSVQTATPRWEETAEIFPTMFYALKTDNEEPVQQSVLLVNPSKSDKARRGHSPAVIQFLEHKFSAAVHYYGRGRRKFKLNTFSLRLGGNCNAGLEKEAVSIKGDYVERVTVTVNPEKEMNDVYIDLLEGGHLYDKIRVQVNQR